MSPVYVGLTDKAFLRFHHGHGVPVISQTIAVLEHRLSDEQLRSMYEILCAGAGARRVYRPAVPFARWRWVPAQDALPLSVDLAAIDEGDVLAWANTQAQYPLDPENGYGWRMSAVPTRSGGMVWSVIASHAIADGHAGLMAMAALVHPELASAAALGAVIDRRGDLRDGLRRSVAVARGVATEARRMVRDPAHRTAVRRALTAREPVPAGEPLGWREGSVAVTFDAVQWNTRAAQRGGSPNTLYLALVADLLRHCSLVGPDGALVLLTAVRILREQDQADSNSFARVPIVVDPAWLDSGDLAPLRMASKAAFANVHDVGSGSISRPRNMPAELIDVLPDGLVERLAEPSPITVGMCSNMGVVDSFVPTAMRQGANPSMFMMRGVFQGIDAPRADRQPIALATWFSQFDGKIQWVLESLKPEMAHSDEELVFLARLIAESWDLEPLHVTSGDGNRRTTYRKFS